MGINVKPINFYDAFIELMMSPANKIIFTINPTKYFRLEPEFVYNSFNDKNEEQIDRSFYWGIGGFGMYQVGKTNFYGGLRFGYLTYLNDYEDYSNGEIGTSKTHLMTIGSAFGAEFFLGKHFSIGGEIGFKYSIMKDKNTQVGEDDLSFIETDSRFIVRFCF